MANEKNFECARYHYLLSKDGVGCAKILMKIAAYRSELDMVGFNIFEFNSNHMSDAFR